MEEVLDIDLTGTWIAKRVVLPAMGSKQQQSGEHQTYRRERGRRGYPIRAPYAASKCGDERSALKLDRGPANGAGRGSVNCICTGSGSSAERINRVAERRAQSDGSAYEAGSARLRLASGSIEKGLVTEEEVDNWSSYYSPCDTILRSQSCQGPSKLEAGRYELRGARLGSTVSTSSGKRETIKLYSCLTVLTLFLPLFGRRETSHWPGYCVSTRPPT